MSARFKEYRSLWMRKTSAYADEFGEVFFAVVAPNPFARGNPPPSYPRPHKVEHLISAVLEPGGPRYYCFKTKAERDSFVTLYIQLAKSDGSMTPASPGPDVPATALDSTGDTSPSAGGGIET